MLQRLKSATSSMGLGSRMRRFKPNSCFSSDFVLRLPHTRSSHDGFFTAAHRLMETVTIHVRNYMYMYTYTYDHRVEGKKLPRHSTFNHRYSPLHGCKPFTVLPFHGCVLFIVVPINLLVHYLAFIRHVVVYVYTHVNSQLPRSVMISTTKSVEKKKLLYNHSENTTRRPVRSPVSIYPSYCM